MSQGQAPHVPTDATRKQVETMSGFGVPQEGIASSIGITRPTLAKYYPDELDAGTVKANSAVAQSLYKKALGDGSSAVTAAIFWLKTRAGWKESQDINIRGELVTRVERVLVDPKAQG
tara:strand:+ start:70 stop:423 length:354 start_codon:yes stop_codon:yes gene_type:complete